MNDRDGQTFAKLALLDVEKLAEEGVHVPREEEGLGAHVRGNEVGNGVWVGVGEVQDGHAVLVDLEQRTKLKVTNFNFSKLLGKVFVTIFFR